MFSFFRWGWSWNTQEFCKRSIFADENWSPWKRRPVVWLLFNWWSVQYSHVLSGHSHHTVMVFFSVGLWLVMEFAEHGNLQNYLRSKRPVNKGKASASTSTCNSHGSCKSTRSEVRQSCLPVSEWLLFDYSFQVAKGMDHLVSMKVCNWQSWQRMSNALWSKMDF